MQCSPMVVPEYTKSSPPENLSRDSLISNTIIKNRHKYQVIFLYDPTKEGHQICRFAKVDGISLTTWTQENGKLICK
jgi:hypothetical protein